MQRRAIQRDARADKRPIAFRRIDGLRRNIRIRFAALWLAALSCGIPVFDACGASTISSDVPHDLIIRNGIIYDGSGGKPYPGEIAIDGDRIAHVGPPTNSPARKTIDAGGKAVAPGFINMLSQAGESLLLDYRAVSDITQGVTLEVFGESSAGPLDAKMKAAWMRSQGDSRFNINWTTLGGYLDELERRGTAPNVASFVSAAQVREYVVGSSDVPIDAGRLEKMKLLVRQAMEEGALGVTTALLYPPAMYARPPELIELATVAGRCGGVFSVHVRSEGDRVEESIQEAIDISGKSGTPLEIYHLKTAGRENWPKMDRVLAMIDHARAAGHRITANMYPYPAAATGLNAAIPPWLWDRIRDAWDGKPVSGAERRKGIAEMRERYPSDWENWLRYAGADGVLFLGFRNQELRTYIGKTLAEVAGIFGKSAEETIIDLMIRDKSRVEAAYFLIDESNIARIIARPWVSFGSDYMAIAPEGVFRFASAHPRAYGNFARVFAKYVREDRVLSVEEAVRRMTSLPADNLSLTDRGRLKVGAFADVVVFDPARIQDRATFRDPHVLSSGVSDVVVNGTPVLEGGKLTYAAPGRVLRGRAWTGAGNGCRASSSDWRN